MQDPGALAASLLQKHFPKFGTFRRLCTYNFKSNSSYDPVTGETINPSVSTDTLHIVFADFTFTMTQAAKNRPDGVDILSTDKMAIFPSLDLIGDPSIDDTITDNVGIVWRVMAISSDPLPAHYSLHVRPTNA